MRLDRNLAIQLRKNGNSYTQISNQLNIPKSTLSGWLKNFRYSQRIRNQLQNSARRKASGNISRWNREKHSHYLKLRYETVARLARTVPVITRDNLFFIGLALFWAEGSKKERFSIRFANSDPYIIKLWIRFLENICQISKEKLRVTIHLHPNIKNENAIQHWSQSLNIPREQFLKSQTKLSSASKSKRPAHSLPYGTCHVYVGGSVLKQKIDGWIEGLRMQVN